MCDNKACLLCVQDNLIVSAHGDHHCCGSGLFILNPGSRIQDPIFSIPDPGFRVDKITDPGSASKNLSIFYKKNLYEFSKIRSGMFIPDPGSRVEKAPNPGYGSATLAKTN